MEVYDKETLINDARKRAISANDRIDYINSMLNSGEVTNDTIPSVKDLVLQRSLAYDDYNQAIADWGKLTTQ